MTESQSRTDSTDAHTTDTPPTLPEGWAWAGGSIGTDSLTYNFGTEYTMGGPHAGSRHRDSNRLGGFSGVLYTDPGEPVTVSIRPVIGVHPSGDPEYGYADVSRQYDTVTEAEADLPRIIQEEL